MKLEKQHTKKILLILSTTRTSVRAIEYAVELAKKNDAELLTLFILETEVAGEVFETFSDIGFIGDKPGTKLIEAMMREFRQRAYQELKSVEDYAKGRGVDNESIIEKGDFIERSLWVIDKYKVDTAVAIKKKRSAIASYFVKSRVLSLKDQAPCEVEVFEEE